MGIKGAVDAAVNGGVPLYRSAFLSESYNEFITWLISQEEQQHRPSDHAGNVDESAKKAVEVSHKEFVQQLQDAIDLQVNSLSLSLLIF